MKKKIKVSKQALGKKSRAAGKRFELKVRADLESKGWIVDRWTNNVDIKPIEHDWMDRKGNWRKAKTKIIPHLIPAKNRFLGPGKPMMLGAGFPDFIAIKMSCGNKQIFELLNNYANVTSKHARRLYKKYCENLPESINQIKLSYPLYKTIGVECKSNGYLDKEEKLKCKWLLANNIFGRILLAKKGKKRGEIIYKEFK